MNQDRVILCASSAYDQKFFINPDFQGVPESIKDELKILCVLYTEEVGGILTLEFEEDGSLYFNVSSDEADYLFDEIGSVLKIKQIQRENKELLESLELFYKAFYLHEDINTLLSEEE